MAYVQVPKDLTKVKTKVMFNLTKRQLICFGIAAGIGIPFYFLTRKMLGSTVAASFMVILMLPCFLFAMYEKDGRPLEVILKNIIEARFIRPGIRIYQTDNFYAAIQREIYEKEVLGIEPEKEKTSGSTNRSGREKAQKSKKPAGC